MKRYTITFMGRRKGAIGIHRQITDYVDAENEMQGTLKMYDRYDHILNPVVVSMEDWADCSECNGEGGCYEHTRS